MKTASLNSRLRKNQVRSMGKLMRRNQTMKNRALITIVI